MSDDEYNPDNFDWGPQTGGIPTEEIGDDVLRAAVFAALDVHEQSFSWSYIKKDDILPSKLKLFRATVIVDDPEKRAALERNWPCYSFVWDTAHQQHDHPYSHTQRELAELDMVGDHRGKYIDLFGTPSRNSKYKRAAVTLYAKKSARDYMRYQDLTGLCLPFDMHELCNPKSELGKIDRVLCTQALYYLSMQDVARIVNTSGSRRFEALIHRHPDTHGFLNQGEQEFWVGLDGNVLQRNVKTGQKYSHPSMEALFHQESAKTGSGGVVWSIRTAGEDSYIVTFVAAPNDVCEDYVPLKQLKPHTRKTVTTRDVTVHSFLGWTWIVSNRKQGKKVILDDVDLFKRLRNYVALKPRTPKLRTLCANLALRLCNKEDIISIHGGGCHDVPESMLSDYVEAAFYCDVEKEYVTAIAHWKDNKDMVQALNSYYEKGTIPTDLGNLVDVVSGTSKLVAQVAKGSALTVYQEFEYAFSSDNQYKRVLDHGRNVCGIPELITPEFPNQEQMDRLWKKKRVKLGPSGVPW